MVVVKLSSALSKVANSRVKDVDVVNGQVKDVLGRLADELGPEFERLTFSDGKLVRSLNVYLNGTDIRKLRGLHTPVSQDDEITIITSIAGGQLSTDSKLFLF